MARVLVVEDQKKHLDSLRRGLEAEGYEVIAASTGETGFALATSEAVDAIVLDLMLPGRDGLGILRELRSRGFTMPILVLTARDSVEDRVQGLDEGANDYLVKPFAFAELLARVRVLARRPANANDAAIRLTLGSIELDLLKRTVVRAGKPVDLLPQEFRLLEYFARNPDRMLTKRMLLENVWGIHFDPQTSVVESHISRLRAKINQGFEGDVIQTVRGTGYKFLAPH